MKPGTKTSEFWLTLAVNVASLLASVSGALPAKYAALVSAVSTALYSLARGWAKSSGLPPAPPGSSGEVVRVAPPSGIPMKVNHRGKTFEYDRMSGTGEAIYVRRSKEGVSVHVILTKEVNESANLHA